MHIEQIILKTTSISRTRLFYTKTLELAIINETDERISFNAGKSIITFEAVKDIKPVYHFAFNITNNKFSDGFEWINRKLDVLLVDGLPIASYNSWNAESFYFYDNNGNILEFIARFDLPYHSASPFSVNDIQEISEVGIAFDNVKEAADNFHKQYNIPYFSKSKPTDDFTVMGDDNGLLILSKTGRNWVPTHKPALAYPITIKADGRTIKF